MSDLKKLQEQLKESEKQHEIDKRVLRRQINRELMKKAEEDENNILRNYEMGMLTPEEAISQRIDVLKNLSNLLYRWEEVK
jgi:hypothetical protein